MLEAHSLFGLFTKILEYVTEDSEQIDLLNFEILLTFHLHSIASIKDHINLKVSKESKGSFVKLLLDKRTQLNKIYT